MSSCHLNTEESKHIVRVLCIITHSFIYFYYSKDVFHLMEQTLKQSEGFELKVGKFKKTELTVFLPSFFLDCFSEFLKPGLRS